MEKDLQMTGNDYNIALCVFFVPYILLEVPCNMILKRIKPAYWLSGIMVGWGELSLRTTSLKEAVEISLGIITVCQGITQSFAGLVVCRVLLGIFEAGFVPGIPSQIFPASSHNTP